MKIRNKKLLSMMKFCEPMAMHTTFKIGGPADIWAQPSDMGSLAEIVNLCKQDGIPTFVVGNGSNLLVSDKGIAGCVLNLNREGFGDIGIDGVTVKAGAGLPVTRLLAGLCDNELSGLEFLAGIPATVGGALVTNAGGRWQAANGKRRMANIGDFVEQVTVLDRAGQVKDLDKKQLIFRYRGSNLEKYIVLKARLKLQRGDKKIILRLTKEYLAQKRQRQELDKPSAGCIFKNPPGDSAGRVIELSGLKGKRIGGAMVSERHANFIINAGRASCGDVLSLMDAIRKKVKIDHGILLEPEIRVLG